MVRICDRHLQSPFLRVDATLSCILRNSASRDGDLLFFVFPDGGRHDMSQENRLAADNQRCIITKKACIIHLNSYLFCKYCAVIHKRLKHTVIDDGHADICCRQLIPALGSFAYFYAQDPAIKSLIDLLMIERSHRLISAF